MRCACGYLQRDHDPVTLRCPLLQRGTFREPDPVAYRPLWHGLVVPVELENVKARDLPDRVPRREAHRLDEISPGAMKLGKKAADAGATVVPWFRQLHDKREWCILQIERGTFRAIAIWRRTDGKWAWLSGAVDRVPVGARRLGELVSELGEQGRSLS